MKKNKLLVAGKGPVGSIIPSMDPVKIQPLELESSFDTINSMLTDYTESNAKMIDWGVAAYLSSTGITFKEEGFAMKWMNDNVVIENHPGLQTRSYFVEGIKIIEIVDSWKRAFNGEPFSINQTVFYLKNHQS